MRRPSGKEYLGKMLGNPGEMGLLDGSEQSLPGFFICSRGLQNGLEKITKWMMAALLVLILVLAGHSLILPGAKEGLSFYLLPDIKRAADVGLGSVIMGAMNQSFFTLSLGIAAMEIFEVICPRTTHLRAKRSGSAVSTRW